MKISKIDIKEIKKDLIKLLKINDIKASNINFDDQNNIPYIHFDLDLFNEDNIIISYNSNTTVNDEISDPENNKFIDIYGMDPNAIIKGPIKYKELKYIYNYLGGSKVLIFDNDNVFFCFGDKFKNKLNEIL